MDTDFMGLAVSFLPFYGAVRNVSNIVLDLGVIR
jgi:hypothetical protein